MAPYFQHDGSDPEDFMFNILADTMRTATLTAPRRDTPEVPSRPTFYWWRQDKTDPRRDKKRRRSG